MVFKRVLKEQGMWKNVLEYLEASEEAAPDKTAYSDRNKSLTFHEFAGQARRIGSFLARGQVKGRPVAVFMEKSVDMIAGFMGAVYAGCFYCPIDVSMPESRIRTILAVLRPAAILSAQAEYERVKALAEELGADEEKPKVIVFGDALSGPEDPALLSAIRAGSVDSDPLYVLFTSGSTGIPKGVVVSHRVIINNMEWLSREYDFGPDDVLGNQVPFYFDVSDHDIFSVMKFGCSMAIIPQELFAFPVRLVQFLNENRVTAVFWVPFALCMAANLNAFASGAPLYLRYVFFAGEVMPVKQLNYWRKYVPGALYANMYGPTETYVCTYYNVTREFHEHESIPIGRACGNVGLLVLDSENRPVEPGDGRQGELCVKGCALSLGYYNNPEKTAERFVQNPLQSAYPELIYRTGDLVTYNEQGDLMYLSRSDFQIKHLGCRIELGEIETAAGAVDGVQECACIYDMGRKMILLVFSGAEMGKREMTKALQSRIPRYMLPNRVIHMEELPRNANGKVDRRKLEEMWT